jgi:arylsulfate sulfotransferase
MKKLSLLIVIIVVSTVIYFYYGVSNISDVSVQQDSTNATRAFIYYEAKDTSIAVFAEYWEDGKEVPIRRTPEVKKNQPVVLLGLHGDKAYNVRLISNGRKTDLVKFTTESIPKSMLKSRWLEKLDEMPSGYILSQRYILRKRNPFGYVYMTDFAGETIWYQKIEGLPKISGFTKNETVLVVSGNPQHERSAGNRLFEFDLLGRKILDIKLDSLKEPMEIHHDVSYGDDGNLLALTYDKKEFKIKGKLTSVKGDAIVRMDTLGKILWRWSVFDAEDPTRSNLKIDSLGEWGHANTLYQDSDGNYLLSFRDWNQIWKVNSKSGAVMWRLGENGTVQAPDGFSFFGQHSIHINKDGDFMMYDNGVKNKKSQILCFQVNEKEMKVVLKNRIILPDKLYSQKRGSAYFIDDGRILVCAPESSAIAIIDLNGKILARASTGLPDYYRATFIPSLY